MTTFTTQRLVLLVPMAVTLGHVPTRSAGVEPANDAKDDGQSFILKIDALHSLSGDKLDQEIIIKEASSFYVSTRVRKIRWTFSGDVGHVIKGKLPLMMKSRWYESPKSNETMLTPWLLEINGKPGPGGGAIHGHGVTLTVRDTTEADKLLNSEVMERVLERMIREFREVEAPAQPAGKER